MQKAQKLKIIWFFYFPIEIFSNESTVAIFLMLLP